MKVLVTGVSGQIGGELMALGIEGCELIPADHQCLDLADQVSIERGFAELSPDVVVNCAAYTAVDQAENESERAFAVNAEGPEVLAKLCAASGIALVHLSTDYVFDGSKSEAYLPDDPVRPLGVYGASKEAGERAIREICPHHIIIRTAWVFSARSQNFVKTMLRVGALEDQLQVVTDQVGCPTSAHDVAQAIAAVVTTIQSGNNTPWGTYHFCNAGIATWHELAETIFEVANGAWGRRPSVQAITSADCATKASRPANSVLDTETFKSVFGLEPRHWCVALEDVMSDLLREKKGALF